MTAVRDVEAPSTAALTAGRTALGSWWPSLRAALVVFVPVRVGLFLLGLVGTGLLPRNPTVDVPGWPATEPSQGWHAAFTAWERHDALWFLRLADTGYAPDDGSAAFFPLYPLLVRAVGTVLGGSWLPAAYVVSSVALVAGLTVLHRLTLHELGSERLARRTVLYVVLFPTGLFLFAPYSEALFLALSVGCLYAARRSAWLPAAALGALASGTRSAGVLLVLPLAVEALLQYRASSGPRRSLRLLGRLAAAAAGLGTAAYLLWWQVVHDDGVRPLEVQRTSWQREPAWPWDTLVAGAREGLRYLGTYAGGYHTLDLLLVGAALAAGVWTALRLRATWSVWLWASLVLPLTMAFAGRPLLSVPRYLVVLPPLFWCLARVAERRRVHDAVVAVSAAGLGVCSLLFVNGYYVL
jgi:hypothetical protein